jgi:hypothetical protein
VCAVSAQLEDKRDLHRSLLQLLDDCGALPRLHASPLRCLFEDGQRLAAAAALRDCEAKLADLGAGVPSGLHFLADC